MYLLLRGNKNVKFDVVVVKSAKSSNAFGEGTSVCVCVAENPRRDDDGKVARKILSSQIDFPTLFDGFGVD